MRSPSDPSARPLLMRVALAAVTFFALLVPAASAASATHTVPFEGALIDRAFSGSFTLDHFEVKTPIHPLQLAQVPAPTLVAVGTVTAVVEPPLAPPVTFTDAPFVWVNLAVSATCGGDTTVVFGPLSGADYVGFGPIYGQPLWDSSVPIPPWSADVHWGITATSSLTLSNNGGLSCAIAHLNRPAQLRALAAALNALTR
jgi:hypothetical protein